MLSSDQQNGLLGARVECLWALTGEVVADAGNNKIRKVTPDGNVTTLARNGRGGLVDGLGAAAGFCFPLGVAVGSDGNIFVADSGNHCIKKITPDGTVSTVAGSGTSVLLDSMGTAAQFNGPESVAVDVDGNLFVADKHNHSVRKIAPDATVITLAGSNERGSADGPGVVA